MSRSKRPGPKPKAPSKFTVECSGCARPFAPRGPKPKSGRHYCSAPECQKKRQRAQYQARRDGIRAILGDRTAPSACQHCGDALPERAWRNGDERGRWCAKQKCREDRDLSKFRAAELAEIPELLARIDVLERAVKYLELSHEPGRLVDECPGCHRLNVINGFWHFGPDDLPCLALKDDRTPKVSGEFIEMPYWEARRFNTPR